MVHNGHPADQVWLYTPRQISAFMALGRRRSVGQNALRLELGLAAARGEPKSVKKQIAKWRKES